MSTDATRVLREALDLPEPERADIAVKLLASLEPANAEAGDVEAAWAVEIERRARRVLSGESSGIEWAEARKQFVASVRR